MKKKRNKYCPERTDCIGDCADCDISEAFDRLVKSKERAQRKAVKAAEGQVASEFLAQLYFGYRHGEISAMTSHELFDKIVADFEKIAAEYGVGEKTFDPEPAEADDRWEYV